MTAFVGEKTCKRRLDMADYTYVFQSQSMSAFVGEKTCKRGLDMDDCTYSYHSQSMSGFVGEKTRGRGLDVDDYTYLFQSQSMTASVGEKICKRGLDMDDHTYLDIQVEANYGLVEWKCHTNHWDKMALILKKRLRRERARVCRGDKKKENGIQR